MLWSAIHRVFRNPRYATLSISTSLLVFAFAVWLPNLGLIATVINSPDASLPQKLAIPISLLGSIGTNFSAFSAAYTITIAILFGINLAMIAYFLRNKIAQVKQSGVAIGFVGITSGILGTGCAACGSFLLMSGLSFVGGAGALAFLPLGGQEFGILGVILLSTSIYLTARQLQSPAVCNINNI